VQWLTLLAVLAALATGASELLAIRRARIEAVAEEHRIEQVLTREENELKALEIENTAIMSSLNHAVTTPAPPEAPKPASPRREP